MTKRRALGQHFLRSDDVARRMVSEARISGTDTVFELGPGTGVLTRLLCAEGKKRDIGGCRRAACDADPRGALASGESRAGAGGRDGAGRRVYGVRLEPALL